jgi:hypothetical protein
MKRKLALTNKPKIIELKEQTKNERTREPKI